jgi:DNA-directed RNA polymerase subunit RPC12/RpoP
MASFTPCAGSGQNATGLHQYPSCSHGMDTTRAKTFGKCPSCGYTVMSYGLVQRIKVQRHSDQAKCALCGEKVSRRDLDAGYFCASCRSR